MNRHLKIAFIVAPFLAIGGYALVDQYQYYQAQKQAKALYPLKSFADCDLRQGCRLKNANVTISVVGQRHGNDLRLNLVSDQDLRGGKLGYGDTGVEVPQRSLAMAEDARHWTTVVPLTKESNGQRLMLRLVLVSGRGRVNIAEVPASINGLLK